MKCNLFLVALLVAGCSKPAEVADAPAAPSAELKPTLTTPAVVPIAPAATPTASKTAAVGPPLERTMADAWANIQNRGFKLEAEKPYDPSAGPSSYKVKGAPMKVVFREHNGDLISVEAMILNDSPKMSDEMIVGFVATVGETSAGLPRVVARRVVASTLAELQSSPQGLRRTISTGSNARCMVDVARRGDGGYSFTFRMEKLQ